MTQTTMTKGEYAIHRGVSPGRVSQYIADGQIGRAALEGQGRRARIIVEVADRHLGQRLDSAQALGLNGKAGGSVLSTEDQDTADPAGDEAPGVPPPAVTPEENHLRIAAEERSKQERMRTAKMAREEAAQTGRYTLTADVRAQLNRIASEAFSVMESAIREMAMALAAEHGMSKAEALSLLNRVWRETRERSSAAQRSEAAALPEHIADPTTAAREPELAA